MFAEDISDFAMAWLHRRATLFNLTDVEIVKCQTDDPRLPAARLRRLSMGQQILRSLKPGGRLVAAEYSLPAQRGEARADQIKMHEIDPALARIESLRRFPGPEIGRPVCEAHQEVTNDDRIAAADMWLMAAVRPQ